MAFILVRPFHAGVESRRDCLPRDPHPHADFGPEFCDGGFFEGGGETPFVFVEEEGWGGDEEEEGVEEVGGEDGGVEGVEVVHPGDGEGAPGRGERVLGEFDDEDDGVGVAAAGTAGGGELARALEDAGDGGDCVGLGERLVGEQEGDGSSRLQRD